MSVDGVTYPLAPPFMVLATQNPVETETTFCPARCPAGPLPLQALHGLPHPQGGGRHAPNRGRWSRLCGPPPPALPGGSQSVHPGDPAGPPVRSGWWRTSWSWSRPPGSSRSWPAAPAPRVSRDLFQASKAYAALSGRDYVTPDDGSIWPATSCPTGYCCPIRRRSPAWRRPAWWRAVLAQVPCRETGEVLAHGQNA